jgi:hypothetical protein
LPAGSPRGAARRQAPAALALALAAGLASGAAAQGGGATRPLAGAERDPAQTVRWRDDCLGGEAGVQAKLNPGQRFAALDRDGDGLLSRAELRACYLERKAEAGGLTGPEEQAFERHFAALDRDRQGTVSEAEYGQFLAGWQGGGPVEGAPLAGLPLSADPAALERQGGPPLLGVPVITQQSHKVGPVEALAVDPQTGKVCAVVPVSRFIGIGERTVAIPLDQLSRSEDALLLSREAEAELARMPAPAADWRRIGG